MSSRFGRWLLNSTKRWFPLLTPVMLTWLCRKAQSKVQPNNSQVHFMVDQSFNYSMQSLMLGWKTGQEMLISQENVRLAPRRSASLSLRSQSLQQSLDFVQSINRFAYESCSRSWKQKAEQQHAAATTREFIAARSFSRVFLAFAFLLFSGRCEMDESDACATPLEEFFFVSITRTRFVSRSTKESQIECSKIMGF